jgi:hypothetical protein
MPELRLLPAQSGVFFREEDHKYFYQAQTGPIEVPSSSHIIALGGGKDFDKTPWRKSLMRKGLNERGAEYFMEQVRDIRAAIGTEVHALIAHGLGLPAQWPKGGFCAEAETIYAQWRKHVGPRIGKVYVIERPMIHPGGCYGFTPDLVAEVDGILSLSDWKTNQAKSYRARYKYLYDYNVNDKMMRDICEHLYRADRFAGKKAEETTARVRDGWQMQQGSYGFGVEAVTGLKVERGINFMLSVDGVKEHVWNLPDLSQGWMQFAGGLLLHHQRAIMSGGHPIFRAGLDALYPLLAR